MKKRIIIILFAVIGTTSVFARDFYIDNMTSVSTTDMIRYGEIGTSLFTGQINFPIPIYTLEEPDFNIKLALIYTSDGFKPCKNSGYVGYNWHLQVGGCITREVRNYPDEIFRYMQAVGVYVEGMYHFTTNHTLNKNDVFDQNSNAIIDCNPTLGFTIGESCTTDVDYQPDIFHFNFLGYQGTFIINNNGEATILSGDYVKVDLSQTIDNLPDNAIIELPMPLTSSKITITTKDGYKYIFGGEVSALEYSYALKNGQQQIKQVPPSISAWYLTKIIAPNKRTITYYYKGHEYTDRLTNDHLLVFGMYYDLFAKQETYTPIPPLDLHLKYNFTKECILDSIRVSGENPLLIRFYNSLSKKMYDHAHYNLCKSNYKLDSIHVVSDGRLIRSASLSYEYKSHNLNGSTYGFHWRFLSNVAVSGGGTYTLSYGHPSTYPSIYMDTDDEYNTLIDSYGYWQYSSLQGLLHEVSFPTGGKQVYTYEANRFGTERRFRILNSYRDIELYSQSVNNLMIGGARISQIETYDGDNNRVEKRTYSYYKEGTYSSSGIYFNKLEVYPMSEYGIPTMISTPTNYSLLDTHIGYSYVEERIQNNQLPDIHKNAYLYDTGLEQYTTFGNETINRTYVDANSSIYHMLSGMMTYDENIHPKGKLLSKKYYKGNTLIKSVLWVYNGVSLLPTELIPMGSQHLGCVDTIVVFSHYGGAPITRKLFIYPDVMTQEVNNDYSQGIVPLTTNKNFLHDKKLRLIRETLVDSKWITHYTQYTYPDNIRTHNGDQWEPLSRLIQTHRINTPIERISGYIDDDGTEYVTSGSYNLYTMGMYAELYSRRVQAPALSPSFPFDSTFYIYDSLILEPIDTAIAIGEIKYYPFLYKTFLLSITSPIADFQPVHAQGSTLSHDSRYTLDCEYNYDFMYRLTAIKPFGKIATNYTWNGIYPVSKTIGNLTTTYTYIPHVGVSSITDPRGITTYYSYDSAGRLIETYHVVNEKKQILNVYQYHVKTE